MTMTIMFTYSQAAEKAAEGMAENLEDTKGHSIKEWVSISMDTDVFKEEAPKHSDNPVVDYDVNLGDSDQDSDKYPVDAIEDSDLEMDPLNLPLGSDDNEGDGTDDGDGGGNALHGNKNSKSVSRSVQNRRFVGETSGPNFVEEMKICGDTVDEILKAVWRVIEPVICREALFVEENGQEVPLWADSEPVYANLGKFIFMANKNRRRITVEQIDSKFLISSREQIVPIYVHVYSNTVSCKQRWEMVSKQLVQFQDCDRAGAPSNQSLSELADELREIHGRDFSGQAFAWKLWATHIHAAPAHDRERRKTELPPQSVIKFFRSVPTSEAVRMENTRNGLTVASTINDAYTMQDSIRPEESTLSRSLADNVSDIQDMDHM
ncbi:uncharacterized protein LOC129737797 [Uranotaenia lowii]|uniref:uncharacterized protein LOC129737797 n=1 Tax=Uranotaenia lowii TaxID=190385 RepID=UPI00247874D9|nr:uncharacterized protein LOC129737797 [Uranotaenia lowii]